MATAVIPYVTVKPGDLISADLFNTIQEDVKADIASQIATAVGGIASVQHADDAATLDGKTTAQLIDDIINRVKALIPGRTGYMQTFNRLRVGKERVIKHDLGAPPVVDVYQLDYFNAVCATGDTPADVRIMPVNFYLYHSSETKIRVGANPPTAAASVTIYDPENRPIRIPFKEMLVRFGVDLTKDTETLDELEQAFWAKLFASPNDTFDSDQYCHSPWFEKCCGEKRSLKEIGGDFDNLFFKMEPRKTINFMGTLNADGTTIPPTPAPTKIQVAHLDYHAIGITLLETPTYPTPFTPPLSDNAPAPSPPADFLKELKVMVILKA